MPLLTMMVIAQTVWGSGMEPWRACGLPVNLEQDLAPEKVTRVQTCQRNYYNVYRKVPLTFHRLIMVTA